MFGYVKVARGALRVREYEYYRASYCGLCRAMGKCTGQCSRLLLSYDLTFLANVRMALTGEKATFQKRRCVAHPFHARMMMERNAALDHAAHAAAILAYEKCADDVRDERGFGRLAARFKRLFCRHAYLRARRHYPQLAEDVRGFLLLMNEKEKERRASVDEIAVLFGEMLGEIMAFGLPPREARVAEAIGRQTGRFIYIVDAIDDMAEDEKRGRFNPFLLLFGGMPTKEEREGVKVSLMACLSDMEAAFDLIEDHNDLTRREILKNILYLGMPQVAHRVLYGDPEQKEEEIGEQQSL